MIDPTLIKYLGEEAQTELRNWENLFAGRGWKQLTTVLDNNFKAMQASALSAQTWEEVLQARGQMDSTKFIFNLPDIVEQQYTAIAEEAMEAAQESEATEAEAYE